MRVPLRPFRLGTAAACLTAAVLASAAFTPPPEPPEPRPVNHGVRLAAAPALGAIPLAFVRNQFEILSLGWLR